MAKKQSGKSLNLKNLLEKQEWMLLAFIGSVYIVTMALSLVIRLAFAQREGEAVSSTAMILYFVMNLIPAVTALILLFLEQKDKKKAVSHIIWELFLAGESPWIIVITGTLFLVHFFGNALLGNITISGNMLVSISYLPIALFSFGLTEIGWRGYFQTRFMPELPLNLRLMVISFVILVWQIPILSVSWAAKPTENWILLYLLLLGNTFMLGTIRSMCKGVWVCILFATVMNTWNNFFSVGGKWYAILIITVLEIVISIMLQAGAFAGKFGNITLEGIRNSELEKQRRIQKRLEKKEQKALRARKKQRAKQEQEEVKASVEEAEETGE